MSSSDTFSENIRRFTGFAEHYNRHRPSPPDAWAALIGQVTGTSKPDLIVDLGSGTGLSTRYWADKAARVTGIEPTADMRQQAETETVAPNISYREGFSHQTGLSARCAQIVTCMQALHWMEPTGTFAEAARILVPGGVFTACDYDWPPVSGSWEADAAFETCIHRGRQLEKELRLDAGLQFWDKAGHFTRLKESGCFRHVKDAVIHHSDLGNAERLVGVLMSQGYIVSLLKTGVSEEQLGITQLRVIAERTLGPHPRPWFWSARVRLGVV